MFQALIRASKPAGSYKSASRSFSALNAFTPRRFASTMPEMQHFRIVSHKIPCSYIREYPRATASSQEEQLWFAAKQYIPVHSQDSADERIPITIIAAHANGFPKELYEPLWDDILPLTAKTNFRIGQIWIADTSMQGQSGVYNEELLGNDPGWYDFARDIMFMINLKRIDMPRPIFAIGHSMGGAALVNVALTHPRLFQGMVLLDPVIQSKSAEYDGSKPNIARMSTYRRDIWPSKEEAAKAFLKSPFYQTWDKRVFDRWIGFGLRDLPTAFYPDEKGVTLTTKKADEVHNFLRPNYRGYGAKHMNRKTHPDIDPSNLQQTPLYRPEPPRTLKRLPELRPSVYYIFGEKSDVQCPEWNEEKLSTTGVGVGGSGGRADGRVSGLLMPKVGHLIAMENPKGTAELIVKWLQPEVKRWKELEDEYLAWTKKSLQEKQGLDDEWKESLGGDPRKDKNKKKSESKL